MASLTSSVENFVSAIFGIFRNVIDSIFAVFTSILALFQSAVVGVFDLAKSFLNFLLSNIFVLSVIAIGFVLYTAVLQKNATGQHVGATGKKKVVS
ncbi:hypothetical protein TWF106_011253 [Orbilia oligospora]|uniref:Uncharacterized protein n=1 Tax=Orbilia oligospora TaxID=2813651 RepID=A0A6G1MH33_ORBOL|nr:hypothetical protein TWF788_002936 [Orbilia oligospora]KAF3202292.1 hypothetical protein TWF679_010849 [Orbilia oligospora]KAF3226842.1 hypothetical protein TWF106_011253 [Orbilia oligospora]KAF3229561.1 hypothetical protein TWF191_001282 [Orbilia oligospora]KAF3258295.1 hypothetical protein TWF192_000426 [Orbilia oligospora]